MRVLLTFMVFSTCLMAQPQEIVFPTADSHLRVTSHNSLMPTTGFTLEAWVFDDPSQPWGFSGPTVVHKGLGLDNSYVLELQANQAPRFALWTTAGLRILVSSLPVPLNTWTHLAVTWDGATVKIYVNGVLSGSAPLLGTMIQSNEALTIGRGNNSNNYNWSGRFDELRIWNYARSEAQVLDTMHAQLDHEPGLNAAWHFDGNFDDATGGNSGVLQGSVALVPASSPVEPLQLVSASRSGIGETLNFKLVGALPNAPYFLDNSFAGANLGMPLIAPLVGQFPLDAPLLNMTFGPAAPGIFVDYLGFTNAQGEATAQFHVPNFQYLVGLQLSSAGLYLTNLQPMILGEISRVVTTVITGPSPMISLIAPAAGPVSGGWPMSIHGQNFSPAATVFMDGNPAGGVVVHSSTHISCLSPAHSGTGLVDIEITDPLTATLRQANAYNYVDIMAASSVVPESAAPGDVVTVTGVGFQTQMNVTVDGIAITPISVTSTSLQFTMPGGVGCVVPLVVATPEGQTAALTMNPIVVVSATAGASGPAAGGTTFFLLGQGFLSQTTVSVGGNMAVITDITPSLLKVVSPPGTLGLATVIVANPDGCMATADFLYN